MDEVFSPALSGEIDRLHAEHRRYAQRLEELLQKPYLSEDEQLEEVRLKKTQAPCQGSDCRARAPERRGCLETQRENLNRPSVAALRRYAMLAACECLSATLAPPAAPVNSGPLALC